MKNPNWTDEALLDAIESRDAKRLNEAFRYLYESGPLRGAVWQQVKSLGGDEADFKEVFNLALVKFDQNVQERTYDPALSRISTYIVNIARQLFYTQRRADSRRRVRHEKSVAEKGEPQVSPYQAIEASHKKDILEGAMTTLGDKCKQALKLFSMYYSMAEIAEEMNYHSADVAKSALYECRKRLTAFLSGRPDLIAELLES